MFGRIEQYAGLAHALGTTGAVRAVVALRAGRPVPFVYEGRTMYMPAESATSYHLRNSIPKLARLAGYVAKGDCVFDIGAHAGVFSALAQTRAAARVVAVEPDAQLHGLIATNAPSAELVEAAVSGDPGPRTLWRVPASTQTSSLDQRAAEEFGQAEAVEVEAMTLADLASRFGQPDVLKLDIQGQELDVVQAGWDIVREVRVLLVEATLLDRHCDVLLSRLRSEFGDPDLVNDVYAGADVAFTR